MNFWLLCILRELAEHRDLGRVFGIEVQVRLPLVPSRRNPDLMFVSNTSMSQLTATYLDGPPDLAMEIVSPDSIARDWRDKFLEYEKSGVREYWLIDPTSQRCEVYALGRSKKFVRFAEDPQGRIHSKVLRGLYVRPTWMWQTPRPTVAGVLKELGIR